MPLIPLLSLRIPAAALAIGLACATALAAPAEPESCRTVRLATPGWTDIDATNSVASLLLKALGYQPSVATLSVPMAYLGLRNGQVDAFLGNWMPAQSQLVEPLLAQQQVELLGVNLPQARFTLAVPAYVDVKSFADLAARGDQFGRRIYGIEAGAPANALIRQMIERNAYGLGGWKLVESSDTGLLAQLDHEVRDRKPMVFLAWEPHVMNSRHAIRYLSGGEAYFGPDTGAASVRTVSRRGYRTACANAGRLLSQLSFSVALENELIAAQARRDQAPEAAARRVLQAPAQQPLLRRWLEGVQARDGRDGWAAVQGALSAP